MSNDIDIDIDIDKAYVSPEDIFLVEFNANHKKTASQIAEKNKNAKIAHMRDEKNYEVNKKVIWEEF